MVEMQVFWIKPTDAVLAESEADAAKILNCDEWELSQCKRSESGFYKIELRGSYMQNSYGDLV